jgi:hypothetical protein
VVMTGRSRALSFAGSSRSLSCGVSRSAAGGGEPYETAGTTCLSSDHTDIPLARFPALVVVVAELDVAASVAAAVACESPSIGFPSIPYPPTFGSSSPSSYTCPQFAMFPSTVGVTPCVHLQPGVDDAYVFI